MFEVLPSQHSIKVFLYLTSCSIWHLLFMRPYTTRHVPPYPNTFINGLIYGRFTVGRRRTRTELTKYIIRKAKKVSDLLALQRYID